MLGSVVAQDIHFSQFYASPLTLNPANTGNFEGDWRIANNYRTQWKVIGNPFVTNAIAFDKQFHLFSDNIGAGIVFVNDQSGDALLQVNKFLLSGAYRRAFNGHNVSVGVQGGIVMKSFSIDALTFPDQFDMTTGYFSSQLSHNEPNVNNQMTYVDLNAGVMWDKKFGKIHPRGGVSFFHLNTPNESFFNVSNDLKMRQIISGGARFELGSKFYVDPNFLVMTTTKATDVLIGSLLGYKFEKNAVNAKSFFIGMEVRDGLERNTDAAVAITGMEFKHLYVGVSYDINVSELEALTNRRGAFEVAVIYTALSTVLTKSAIPCDRY
jgi:type IX secretion system PorP/SprF family membrane protein